MNVLILGGTGFIGARVARLLVDRGARVTCLDLVPEPSAVADLGDRVEVLQGDVADADALRATIRAVDAERFIHLAYVLNAESAQDSHNAVRVNALGTSNVLEAARIARVARVVFASSVAVFGDQSMYGERALTEDDAPSPRTVYGATKLLNEYQATAYRNAFGLSVVGFRIGVVFGHGRRRGQGMWAAQFASEPAVGRSVLLPFAAEMRAAMVYVDDVADVLVRALLAPAPMHVVYNAGGRSVSLRELAEIVRSQIPAAQIGFGTGSAGLPHLIDSRRAENEFGWRTPALETRIAEHIATARAAVVPT